MTYAIITKLVIEELHPFGVPFLRAIAPCTGPLDFTPRVSEFDQPLAFHLSCVNDAVGMFLDDSFDVRISSSWIKPIPKMSCRAAKEEFLIDFGELFLPELVRVQNIRCKNLRGYAASEILDPFSAGC